MIGRILPLLFILAPIISHSQEREVFGRILDAENQKPIYGANVIVFESTQGTTTNAQGFFKFSIPADKKSLVVSHIGYQTSKLEIPADSKFLLKLIKEFQALNPLDIKYFEVKDLPKLIGDSTTSERGAPVTEKNAEYRGGWEYFYNDVAKVLKEDSIYKTLPDSAIHLRFAVEANGTINFISITPDNPNSYNALVSKASNFTWTSAIQNNRKVVQYFNLPIRNFAEEIFTVVEEPAKPIGGIASFYKYIGENMKYPVEARRFGVEGKVFIQFVINADGTLSDLTIIKGIGGGCDEEAIRVVSKSPNWIPGRQRGQPIRQRYTMPIIFKLGASLDAEKKEDLYSVFSGVVEYPAAARRSGVEGMVVLKVVLNRGKNFVDRIEAISTIGFDCDAEAIKAIRQIPFNLIEKQSNGKDEIILPVFFGLGSPNSEPVPPPIDTYIAKDKMNSNQILLSPISVIAIGIEREQKTIGDAPLIIQSGAATTPVGLSYNQKIYYSFEKAFVKPLKVKQLAVIGKGLKEIPEGIREMKNLRFLDLENNSLKNLPDGIGDLENLQLLTLPLNEISSLPNNISNLKSLEVLGLGGNKLKELPLSITKLQKLKVIDLASNNISSIPPEIINLRNLEEIFLQQNQISILPDEFFRLNKLKKIYLQGNSLSSETRARLKKSYPNATILF